MVNQDHRVSNKNSYFNVDEAIFEKKHKYN